MTISCLIFPRISYFPRYSRRSGYHCNFLPSSTFMTPYLCLISTVLSLQFRAGRRTTCAPRPRAPRRCCCRGSRRTGSCGTATCRATTSATPRWRMREGRRRGPARPTSRPSRWGRSTVARLYCKVWPCTPATPSPCRPSTVGGPARPVRPSPYAH